MCAFKRSGAAPCSTAPFVYLKYPVYSPTRRISSARAISSAVGAGVRELVAEGRSVVVVAHRITTVRHADRILFLDGGRLVEAGDHEALLAAGGRYADFWRERRAAAGWTIRP